MNKTGNTFAIEGFVDIEIINKKDNTRRTYKKHNTLTKAGAQMFFARSAGQLLKMAGDSFGQTYCTDNWTGRRNNMRVTNNDSQPITNVLANIDTEKASNMTSASTFADIFTDNFDSTEKVIGYANINLQPPVNGKEGVVDYSKSEYVVDPYTRAMRWYYKPGVASGTFNAICMMSKIQADSKIPVDNGCIFGKIIDRVNKCDPNWSANSTALCPPGIPGVTDNDTVLLNFSQNGVSRWKYSISTGEVTQVPDTDVFWVPFAYDHGNIIDYFVENGYLYLLSIYRPNSDRSRIYVEVHNISTQSKITEINLEGAVQTYTSLYAIRSHFLRYNNNVYVTWNCSPENIDSSSFGGRAFRLNSNGTYYASKTNIGDLAAELGITLPSGLDPKIVSFGNYGVNYLVTTGWGTFVVSDLKNIHQSMISVFAPLYQDTNPVMVLFNAGGNSGVLGIGCPGGGNNGTNINQNFITDSNWYTTMNAPTTEYFNDFNRTGGFISLEGWWTSLLSFAILETPITKADTDEMYVSYGYKVVV